MSIIPDIQKTRPKHQIAIHRVGINGLKLPVYISDQQTGVQHTVANIDAYVDLASEEKGTHMSRLAIGIQKFISQKLSSELLKSICKYIAQKCEAKTAQVIFQFPYFINKIAPVSQEPGIIYCNVKFDVTYNSDLDESKFIMAIESFCTSLCPCSKEISDHGAHNQRSKIKVTCEPVDWVWIEDIVKLSEQSSSCELFSVLKREDEKYVTEYAYKHPRFVEDMVRQVYKHLDDNTEHYKWFIVEVWNDESIHQHQAYAKISSLDNC